MKKLSFKIRLPKTVLLSLAGLLLVGGAGAGGAVYLGYLPIGTEDKGHDDAVEVAGVACTTLDVIKLQRNGQRWLRKIVTTSGADGVERVRTALRVAGVMAKSEKADLYQVMVLDQAGPTTRAERRGPAIGAEVLFAPHPDRLPEMTAPFEARYVNATANEAGLFFGEEVVLSPEDVRTTLTRMTDRSDCLDPNAAVAAADAAEGHGGGHAKPAEGHGEAPAEGHGSAPAEGHGETSGDAHGDSQGEAAADTGHGESPAEGSHESAAAEAKPGFLSSVLSMIPGLGGGETASNEAHQPAEGAHPAAGDASSAPHDAAADAHSVPAEKGLLSSLMDKIPFMGGAETEEAASAHAPVAAQGDATANSEAHGSGDVHAASDTVGEGESSAEASADHAAPAALPDGQAAADAAHSAPSADHAAPEAASARPAVAAPAEDHAAEVADHPTTPAHAADAAPAVTVPSDAHDAAAGQAEAQAAPADHPASTEHPAVDPHATTATH
ncbi:hypothetical protein [Rhizobium sp. CC-YZS058]|uniref:hypothetical protein n=1 Tax=Rhizobium sp. CC-YZS058 TaxID=3042153 RepID=UPI002B0587BB|nr:hypothetical protein [Rhizobium sp. CC-YZS058]MEA3533511.1 hypothetical protein [Rhizobium sp. CC-YZS058]